MSVMRQRRNTTERELSRKEKGNECQEGKGKRKEGARAHIVLEENLLLKLCEMESCNELIGAEVKCLVTLIREQEHWS